MDDFEDVGRFAFSRQGLFTNDVLGRQLATAFGGRPIETWPRRFGAVATNLDNGHARVLMSGDGAAAVRASSSVPLVFKPVMIGGERLVDGALVEPVPVAAARAMGADVVLGVDVAYRPYEDRVDGLTGSAFQAMHILINTLAARELAEADVAIRLDVHDRLVHCGPEALIAAGREAVRSAWPDIARAVRARTLANSTKEARQ
jgi:NTE family protein